MTFWWVMLIICAAFTLNSSYKWRHERRGEITLRVIKSYGPSATGFALLTALIALRLALHQAH